MAGGLARRAGGGLENGQDWAGLERDLAAVLPAAHESGDRPVLLERLREYARLVVAAARRLPPVAISDGEYTPAAAWLRRPVFICGHHRSGTTLLQQLLDGHPELLVLPSEASYFTSFAYATRRRVFPADVDRFIAEWASRFVGPNRAPHFKLGRSEGDDCPSVRFARRLLGWHATLLQRQPALRRFALLLALVAAYRDLVAPASQPRRWVEKTPRNERFVSRLRAFPEARFIQMVRDPADTLASMLAVDPSTRSEQARVASHARRIADSLRLATSNATRHRASYLVVRYEDLTGDPTTTMGRVREFLGMAPAASLLTPTELGMAVPSNSSFAWPGTRTGEIYAGRAGSLGMDAEQLLAAYAAAAARPFGYALESPRLWRRLGLQLRGAAAIAGARAHRPRGYRRSNSAR